MTKQKPKSSEEAREINRKSDEELKNEIDDLLEKAEKEKEEADTEAKKKIEEADRIASEDDSDQEDEEDGEDADDSDEEDKDDSDQEDEEDGEDADDSDEEDKIKQKEKKSLPDKDERLRQSTREAQILHSKNKKLTDVIDGSAELPEPTEKELKIEYDEWDSLSEFEQKIAKDNLWNRRKLELVQSVTKSFKDLDAWVEKVDTYVADPKVLNKYQDLEGREEEFKSFVMKPSRRGVDFEVLTSAFLHDVKPIKNKGKMFESSRGRKGAKKSTGKITIAQANVLRKNNYQKYKELLKAGKIDIGSDL